MQIFEQSLEQKPDKNEEEEKKVVSSFDKFDNLNKKAD